jgi:hypothetical protein
VLTAVLEIVQASYQLDINDFEFICTSNSLSVNTKYENIYLSIDGNNFVNTKVLNNLNPKTTYKLYLYAFISANYDCSTLVYEFSTYQDLDTYLTKANNLNITIDSYEDIVVLIGELQFMSPTDRTTYESKLKQLIDKYNEIIEVERQNYELQENLSNNSTTFRIFLSIMSITLLISEALIVSRRWWFNV